MKVMCKNDFFEKSTEVVLLQMHDLCLCFLLLNTRDIWANVENQSLTLQLKEASLKETFSIDGKTK